MFADLDTIADETTTLCGHLDAAEFRLLELIRELDERAPWGMWEVKSCAHWLNWKCGVQGRSTVVFKSARDHADRQCGQRSSSG